MHCCLCVVPSRRSTADAVMPGSSVHLFSTSSESRLVAFVGPRIMTMYTYKLSVPSPNNDVLVHLALKIIRSRQRDNTSDQQSSWILLRVLYTPTLPLDLMILII